MLRANSRNVAATKTRDGKKPLEFVVGQRVERSRLGPEGLAGALSPQHRTLLRWLAVAFVVGLWMKLTPAFASLGYIVSGVALGLLFVLFFAHARRIVDWGRQHRANQRYRM